jgi:magnesium transporter
MDLETKINVTVGVLSPSFEASPSIDDAIASASAREGVAWIGTADPNQEDFVHICHELGIKDDVLERFAGLDVNGNRTNQEPEIPGGRNRTSMRSGVAHLVLQGTEESATDVSTLAGEVEVVATAAAVIVVTRGLNTTHQPTAILDAIVPDLSTTQTPTSGDVVASVILEVIDWYADVLDDVERALSEIADEMFAKRDPDMLPRLYALAKPLHGATVAIQPVTHHLGRILKELGQGEEQGESLRWIGEAEYLATRIARLHVLFHSTLQIYVGMAQDEANSIADERNEITQKMSAFALLLAIPTIVFSIYGMNFKDIQLEKFYWGYPVVIFGTLGMCVYTYIRLRRSGWL